MGHNRKLTMKKKLEEYKNVVYKFMIFVLKFIGRVKYRYIFILILQINVKMYGTIKIYNKVNIK